MKFKINKTERLLHCIMLFIACVFGVGISIGFISDIREIQKHREEHRELHSLEKKYMNELYRDIIQKNKGK